MSKSDAKTTQDLRPGAEPVPDVRRRGGALSPWTWMVLACAVLGASGGVRAWQDYRFATVQDRVETSPFSLKDLPRVLGNGEWRVRDAGESSLDPEVARVAGSTDSVIRTYSNTRTGVSLTVLILFGPAQVVYAHRPDVCYPVAGYRPVAEEMLRPVVAGAGPPAEFRSQIFARQKDRRSVREEVYYSFLHGGRWSPDPGRAWKEFRHNPSMFKVQVQRPALQAEPRMQNNPTEQFLALLLPEIERRVTQARGEGEG